MADPKRRRTPQRASSRSRRRRATSRSSVEVRDLLTNPVYGYGIVLEPTDLVPALMRKVEENLARMQNRRGKPFTLQELDEHFQSYFAFLLDTGSCRRGKDVAPTVSKETWLRAQQVAIRRRARNLRN